MELTNKLLMVLKEFFQFLFALLGMHDWKRT